MSPEQREQDALTLEHFWVDKGDLESWAGYDRAVLAEEFPEILKAWEDYKTARAILGHVIEGVVRSTRT